MESAARRCGLGFWLHASKDVVLMIGDTGVAFRSSHVPQSGATTTVISNTCDGFGLLWHSLEEQLG